MSKNQINQAKVSLIQFMNELGKLNEEALKKKSGVK